jgi:hypothetical protein
MAVFKPIRLRNSSFHLRKVAIYGDFFTMEAISFAAPLSLTPRFSGVNADGVGGKTVSTV